MRDLAKKRDSSSDGSYHEYVTRPVRREVVGATEDHEDQKHEKKKKAEKVREEDSHYDTEGLGMNAVFSEDDEVVRKRKEKEKLKKDEDDDENKTVYF